MQQSPHAKSACGAPKRRRGRGELEARGGIEPPIWVLQTHALPLGDRAPAGATSGGKARLDYEPCRPVHSTRTGPCAVARCVEGNSPGQIRDLCRRKTKNPSAGFWRWVRNSELAKRSDLAVQPPHTRSARATVATATRSGVETAYHAGRIGWWGAVGKRKDWMGWI